VTFLILTQVMYERATKTHVLQHAHVVRAKDKDEASAHIEAWLDEAWPEPAYFDHQYEAHELPGVVMQGDDAAMEFAVSETPLTIAPLSERT